MAFSINNKPALNNIIPQPASVSVNNAANPQYIMTLPASEFPWLSTQNPRPVVLKGQGATGYGVYLQTPDKFWQQLYGSQPHPGFPVILDNLVVYNNCTGAVILNALGTGWVNPDLTLVSAVTGHPLGGTGLSMPTGSAYQLSIAFTASTGANIGSSRLI